jgi:molecular chaperone DnaK (HSP70)
MSIQNQSLSWLTQNWIKILIFFGCGVLVIGIIKIISQLFNSTGPLPTALADLFGAGANLINGIINGCVSQGDCSKSTDQDSCKKINGCDWDAGDKSAQPPTKAACLNTSGRSPGGGGFFSSDCVGGMGAIFALCGALLFVVIGPALKYAFTKDNENINAASEISGKSKGEILKDTVEKTAKEYDRLINENEKAKNADEKTQKLIAKKVAAEEANKQVKDALGENTSLNETDKAAKKSAADKVTTEARKQADDDAAKEGVTDEDIHDTDEIVPPHDEE